MQASEATWRSQADFFGATVDVRSYRADALLPEQPSVAIGAAGFVALLPRFVFSSAVINDEIDIIGGENSPDESLSLVKKYYPDNDTK